MELERYEAFCSLLNLWNARINLVSRKSFDQVVAAHLVDSIHIADIAHSYREHRRVYDIGSGGGFPGIVFGIRFSTEPITLFERTLKKKNFLSLVVSELGLKNVEICDLFDDKNAFGFFTARAVLPREKLFAYLRKHLGTGSRFEVQSGGESEVSPLVAGFRLISTVKYRLPDDFGERNAEVFEVVSRGTKKDI